jgi:hypothetical protein
MRAIKLATNPKGNAMQNIIPAVAAVVIVTASIGNASAQSINYFVPGQGLVGYSQTYGNTTNYFVPGRGLVGTAIRN